MRDDEAEGEWIERLRGELAERPLARAGECPSWQVYADWLLERGDPRGEWLALTREGGDAQALARLGEARVRAADDRHGRAGAASLLALVRNTRGWSHWYGPFVLAAVQPELDHEALAAATGSHGVLLLPARTWVGRGWIDRVLTRAADQKPQPTQPVLLPVDDPAMLDPLASALFQAEQVRRRGDAPLFAGLGEAMPELFPPLMAINPGPVFDPEAMQRATERMMTSALTRMLIGSTAILCCADEADLQRHARDWSRISQLGVCVILGAPALLQQWPHRGGLLDPRVD